MKNFRIALAMSAASVALAGGFVAPAFAQQITTSIQGTVTDENGAAIAGATVVVTDTRTGAARTLTTGSSGTFSVSNLQPGGPYKVSADANGFEGQTVEDVSTTVQGATSLTFSLSSGSGVIVVTGSRVKSTLVAVGPGQSFGADVLTSAPSFNRDVRDVIRIDPRVSLDRDDGGSGQDRISCLGGNDRGNTFTVDGIAQSDIYGLNDTGFSSRSSTPLPYDAIRETQVVFAPFDVDYGQFTGCAINVITKSGSNDYHFGGFFEYSDSGLRGTKVAGRPVAPVKPDKRWGASLSGPIIADKLFIFGAYEHQETGQSQDDGPVGAGYANEQTGITAQQFQDISDVLSSVYGVKTGPLLHNRDYKNDRYFVRGDWQITDNHRLEVTYQHLEESTVKPDDLFTGNSPQAVGANTFLLSGTKSDYWSGRLYSQWTDNFSTELRYAHSKVIDLQDPIGGGEAQSGNPIPRIIVGIDNPTGIDGAVLGGPGTSRSANDLRTTVEQYRAVANYVAGDHKIKLGFELNTANLFNLFVQNATGTLVFRNIDDLKAGLLSPGTGNNQTSTTPVNVVSGATEGAFGNFTATGNINDAAAAFSRSIYSAYLQDEWRISDRLKLVAGLRGDWFDGGQPEYNPVFKSRYGITNNTGFSNISGVILPRAALTYDFNDSSLLSHAQLRAGVGIFSGGDPLVWFGNAFQNDGSAFALGTTQAAACGTARISVLDGSGHFTGVPTCMQASASAAAAASGGNTQSIDPNIKMPTVVRANLGFSTQLNLNQGFFGGWNVTLDYIYSEFRNPYGIVDLAQTVDIRKGLNGYTIDGRPIYAAIDTLQPGCTARLTSAGAPPVFSNVNAVCFTNTANRFDELMLTNTDGYRSHVASFLLSKNFKGGIFTPGGSTFFSFGYAYTNSHDRRNMYNSTAGSNYDNSAAFDRQNPAASPGFYQSKHNISVATNFQEEFFGDNKTSLGFTFVARSGRPYSMTWSGGGVFGNTNSGTDNALVYVPTGVNDPNIAPVGSNAQAVQNLVDFVNRHDCLRNYAGQTVPRNSCTNNWYFDLDLSFSQEIPGPGTLFGKPDKIKLYGMIDNFLNLLDNNWNTQKRRTYYGVQDIATTSGVDAQGRYIITGFTGNSFVADNQVNVSSSVWRIKVGVSYQF